jgi:hypothetical protein
MMASTSGTASGVGTSGGSDRPFGGSADSTGAPAQTVSSGSGQAGGIPQQHGHGTLYGGPGATSAIDMTVPVTMNPLENSGSLTGHILAQGWDQGRDTGRRSNVKVAIAMLLVLLALLGLSLLFLATEGSAFSDWVHGFVNN